MQVTIEIPEPLYHALESRASECKTTLETLVVESASRMFSDQHLAAEVRARRILLSSNLNDFALMTGEEIEEFERQFDCDPERAVHNLGLPRLDGNSA